MPNDGGSNKSPLNKEFNAASQNQPKQTTEQKRPASKMELDQVNKRLASRKPHQTQSLNMNGSDATAARREAVRQQTIKDLKLKKELEQDLARRRGLAKNDFAKYGGIPKDKGQQATDDRNKMQLEQKLVSDKEAQRAKKVEELKKAMKEMTQRQQSKDRGN